MKDRPEDRKERTMNGFAFQVICSGEFLDDAPEYEGDTFLVKTETIRLNPIALNE